jgi:hypothetical protein
MKKFLIIFLSCVLLLVIAVFLRSFYISYYFKHNIINETVDFPVNFETDTVIVDISQLQEEYLLFYFEDSIPSNKELKKIQSVYKSRLMQDNRVKIYIVENDSKGKTDPDRTDFSQANGICFPVISSGGNETLLKNLQIKSFPTALIISKDSTKREIRCRGSLAVAVDCLLALTYAR